METKPSFQDFVPCMLENCASLEKRTLAFAYFRSRFNGGKASPEEIAYDFAQAGLGRQRPDRIRAVLAKSRFTKQTTPGSWMVSTDKYGDIEWELDLKKCTVSGGTETTPPSKPLKPKTTARDNPKLVYVHATRLKELKVIKSPNFDLSRLIKICLEMNSNFSFGNNIATILLLRAFLDHVAPIFGFKTFIEVSNNYACTKSVKDTFQHLEQSSRKIADGHLHTPIRSKEVLPTAAQVNFSQDLDVLLGEMVRILK